MSDDVREAYRRGLDVREYRRMRDEGTLPTNERADLQEAYRLNIPVEELRARRAAATRTSTRVPPAVQRGAALSDMQMADVPGNIPSGPSAASIRGARESLMQYNNMQEADMPGNIPSVSQADIRRARAGIMQNEDMQNADVPGNIPAPGSVNEIRQAMERNQANRDRQRNRPNTRMTATQPEATPDALMNRYNRPTAIGEGGTPQPPASAAGDKPFLDRVLGGIGLRRTNQTGMDPATEALMRDMYGSQYSNQYNMKKGGKVKKMAKGGVVKASSAKSSASRRGDGVASRGKTKGRMV